MKDDEQDDNEVSLPPGLIEGLGSLDAPLDTPDIMRDCVRENYVERLSRADYFNGARRIADDLRRRSFPKAKALELVLAFMTRRLPLTRDHLRNIEKAVTWVYDEAERGLSCRGALVREGLCFIADRTCRFNQIENDLYAERVAQTPNGLPTAWTEYFERVHPTEVWFARMTYGELVRQESRLRCTPGNPNTPILVGFRAIADAVRARERTQAFTKGQALRSVHRLVEVGLVLKVVQGKSGTASRKANGYVRVVPIPPPPSVRSDSPLRSNGVTGGPGPSPDLPLGPASPSPTADHGVTGGQAHADGLDPEERA